METDRKKFVWMTPVRKTRGKSANQVASLTTFSPLFFKPVFIKRFVGSVSLQGRSFRNNLGKGEIQKPKTDFRFTANDIIITRFKG